MKKFHGFSSSSWVVIDIISSQFSGFCFLLGSCNFVWKNRSLRRSANSVLKGSPPNLDKSCWKVCDVFWTVVLQHTYACEPNEYHLHEDMFVLDSRGITCGLFSSSPGMSHVILLRKAYFSVLDNHYLRRSKSEIISNHLLVKIRSWPYEVRFLNCLHSFSLKDNMDIFFLTINLNCRIITKRMMFYLLKRIFMNTFYFSECAL